MVSTWLGEDDESEVSILLFGILNILNTKNARNTHIKQGEKDHLREWRCDLQLWSMRLSVCLCVMVYFCLCTCMCRHMYTLLCTEARVCPALLLSTLLPQDRVSHRTPKLLLQLLSD